MPQVVRLIIELDPQTGSVNVNGPIKDKLFCLGLLELGKKAIYDYDPGKPDIVIPHMQMAMKKGDGNGH